MTAHELLQKYSIQFTTEREQVIQYLMEHRTHPTADEVYLGMKQLDSAISRATVFNTLKVLSDCGAVLTLLIEGGVVRYDICTMPHAHFRCSRCGKITDVDIRRRASLCVPEGFSVCNTQYVLTGICPEYQIQ